MGAARIHLARLASWTIFGSAIDWARDAADQDLDAQVTRILGFVLNGIHALGSPEALPAASRS